MSRKSSGSLPHLPELQRLVAQENGKLNKASLKVIQVFFQSTAYKLIKKSIADGSTDYVKIATNLYGPKFCDDLQDVEMSLSPTKFRRMVADFCKTVKHLTPKSTDLKRLQHLTEYILLRGFVRPITKSPANISKNQVLITDKDLLYVNHVYGLAYIELFCQSVTEVTVGDLA